MHRLRLVPKLGRRSRRRLRLPRRRSRRRRPSLRHAARPAADPPPPAIPRWVMKPGETLEDLLGGRVLAAVGGLAILIGVVLFLVIAVDRGWIGVEARVALAFMGSTVLLGVGLFLYERRGQTDAAVAAVATALASLYASLTYATAVQDVIGAAPGLLVAGIIGAAGAAIAVRWQSQFVAALGILGALAAPVLVDSGTSTLALGFTVIALVSAVAILLWQRWGWLSIGAFLLTAPQVAFWAEDRDDLALPLSMLGLYWCPVRRCRNRIRASRSHLGTARLVRLGHPRQRRLRVGGRLVSDRRPGPFDGCHRVGAGAHDRAHRPRRVRLPAADVERDRDPPRRRRPRPVRRDARPGAGRARAGRRVVGRGRDSGLGGSLDR